MTIGSATDALSIVKDATKLKKRLEQLAKAEKAAENAVTTANEQAAAILAKARETETAAVAKLGAARARLKAAQAAEEANRALVLSAQEIEQLAVAHEKRLRKGDDRLAQDRGIIARDRKAHSDDVTDFTARVNAYQTAIATAFRDAGTG